jgi:glycosyltransferase involved in cell wall biosynthesis
MLSEITPLILTFNEEPNIARTLQPLTWAKRIIILDSYSTDRTIAIAQTYPQVELFQRPFDSFAGQLNYGVTLVKTQWVLCLDADYCLSTELIAELATLDGNSECNSYYNTYKYCVFGKPLRGALLPPRKNLFRCGQATYVNDGHAGYLQAIGPSAHLKAPIYHDDRKSLSRWLWAQDRYMKIEAQNLLSTPENQLTTGDRIRKHKFFAPFIIVIYCLILKGGILDGWAGFYYAFQRMLAETLLAIWLIELENRLKEGELRSCTHHN